MVIIRGTWLFEKGFYFWVRCRHVSHFVWWNVQLQTNSFIEFVIFLPCLLLSPPYFFYCMVGKHWGKQKCGMVWVNVWDLWGRSHFLSLFLWIDSCLAPSPLCPASECSINQSAILKEETSFSVKCEEEGEVYKSCWKKTNPLFSYYRCHLHLLAVVKASRFDPWVFCFHILHLKCEASLIMTVRKLMFCPPSGLNIF